MNTLRCVKGMHDILPEEAPKWHLLESAYRRTVGNYGYEEIRTPILEPIELFVRSIGDATDIVEKEMYSFEDKGNAHLALRPEGTASVIRSFIQHNLKGQNPISKLYYLGPMFRRERPAKGRYRQFFQAGAELIGSREPSADAEIIDMVVQFVSNLGLKNVNVQINSLGDEETRPQYRQALVNYFEGLKARLCNDCRRRLDTNPLRILDCKVPSCGELTANAPVISEFLSDAARDHFEELLAYLERYELQYLVVPTMVRGLDYYTGTIFEIQADASVLGAQTAILGGGRYDDLVAHLGGKPTPAIGFSFGIERLLAILEDTLTISVPRLLYVAAVGGQEAQGRARDLAREYRQKGHRVEVAYSFGSLKSQLKRANRLKAAVALIVGEDELKRGAVTWREMASSNQTEVSLSDLDERIEEIK